MLRRKMRHHIGRLAPIGRSSLIAVSLLILLSISAWGQLYTGSVTGLVTDPSGAVIPAARVALVDQDKGFKFAAATDATGRYLLRPVPPGTYKIAAEAAGFKTKTRGGIIVDVDQNVTVDLPLDVGPTSDSVEVTAAAPLLQAQDAVTGQVVNRELIANLPMIDRNVLGMVYLAPGITPVNANCAPPNCSTGTNFVSNGSRNATADVLLDGVSTTNFDQNSGANGVVFTPSVDAVEEVAVQQSNFTAEYGFTGSTIVNMITRSGSNQFHGSVYDYLQNSVLNANDFFANMSGQPMPPTKKNNFGGTIGGPIQKNKTFFFFDYQGLRQSAVNPAGGPNSTWLTGVPSAAEKQGNFGELCGYYGGSFDSSGRCSAAKGQLWDPYSGVYNPDEGGADRTAYIPFDNLATYMSPGNPNLTGANDIHLPHTPGNLIDPVALKMIQYYPARNTNIDANGNALPGHMSSDYYKQAAVHTNDYQYDAKVDRQFGDKNLLSVKYSFYSHAIPYFSEYGDNNPLDPVNRGNRESSSHLVALNHTYTLSPTMVLSVSYGLTRNQGWFGSGISTVFKGLDPTSTSTANGMPGLGMPAYMDASGVASFPYVSPQSYGGLGTGAWTIEHIGQDVQQLHSSVSWIKGKHELKFGAQALLHRINYTQPGTPGGYFGFSKTGMSEYAWSGGGDGMADFLTGTNTNGAFGQYEIPNFVSTENWQVGGFVQDNWRVTDKLTLNVGLRYDVSLPRTERYNRMQGLDPNLVSPLQVDGLGTLHGGEVFMSSSNRSNFAIDGKDIQPRFGFAYRADPKTVVRGGYGIYYSLNVNGAAGTGALGWSGYDQVTNWITTQNDLATPFGRLSNPFPNGVRAVVGSSLGAWNDVGNGASGPIASMNSTTPYEQTWSFGIQRELPGNFLLDTTYIGKKGTHLYYAGTENLNFLGPQIESYSPAQIADLRSFVPNPFYGKITDPTSSLSLPQVQKYQLLLPYPQFTSFSGEPLPAANSIYNALQVRAEKRMSRGLTVLATYVWSKSIDDASSTSNAISYLGSATASLQDPNNLRAERSLSAFDRAHVFQFTYTYELPIGHGKAFGGHMNPVFNAIVGGWETTGTWRYSDGAPVSLGIDNSSPLPTYGPQRANLSGTLKCNTGSDWLTNYFANPEVVTVPDPDTLGNSSRTVGSCRTPSSMNTQLSLSKDFALPMLREGARMQLRLEAYNALNHPQFAGPNTSIDSGSFGQITSTAVAPRQVQIALKMLF